MSKLDVNTATQEELERIHGIGEARVHARLSRIGRRAEASGT